MANSREMGSGAPALSRSARQERASGLAVWRGAAWSEGLGSLADGGGSLVKAGGRGALAKRPAARAGRWQGVPGG
jgi:hypothetical protein